MSINSGSVFSANKLSEYMLQSLPKEPTPQIRNPYDAIALLSHACMLAVGFRLVGLGEDHKIEASSDPEAPQPLPKEWNASTTSDYAFRYAHTQSSLQYLVKISRLGNKAVINGLGIGDDKVHTFDILVRDFVSVSSVPHTVSSSEGHDEAVERLRSIFISAGRVMDAASLLKLQMIQKLAPGLRKEGYEDSAHSASPNSSSRERQPAPGREGEPAGAPVYDPLRDDRLPSGAQPRPFNDPLAAEPRRPYPVGDFPPPGFEVEWQINRPPGGIGGGRRPLNIGERDLYPPGLGPHDPLRGGGYGSGGGGMHPTFDDPMFGGPGGGVGGYNGQIPPGARYDPIGPGDGPPNLRGGSRFPGGGGGPFSGGRPPNPFGGFGGGDFI
ncbi:hypothetical protein N7G274_003067 [Stereocaulon virgatum]|uniref:Proteasome inhibitor PI31 subunit n=1 Tax=Stereocaulon virgatum TaxID=373712 RepID=A0ABR4AEV6_9LECA